MAAHKERKGHNKAQREIKSGAKALAGVKKHKSGEKVSPIKKQK